MRTKIYSELFHTSVDAMVQIDHNACIVEINNAFTNFFNYTAEEIIGHKLDELVVSEAHKEEAILLNSRAKNGELFTTDAVRIDKQGREFHVFITGIPIVEGNTNIGAFVIYRDRTFEIESKRALLNQKMAFESLFRNSNDAIVRIDINQRVMDINERFEILFGYSLEEIKGKIVDHLIAKDEKIEECRMLTDRLMVGEKIIEEGLRCGKNGLSRTYKIQGVPIIAEGTLIGGYGIYTDITERKIAENKVVYMSYHDQLTGLYNRRFFEEEFIRLNTKRNMPISLIMADVNGLKLINDAFGHQAGDELLKLMGAVLKDNCRESEIIARLSGDEFVILLPNANDEEAEIVVKRIKQALSSIKYKNIAFSMSFGSGSKRNVSDSKKMLFKKVEDQMYRNKLVESPSIRGKMFDTVIKTLHAKNEREERHSSRVSKYSEQIARALHMNSVKIKELRTAGWLHDIGKIAISDSILDKPGKLTEEEWKEIKKHPEIGYRILNSVHEFTELSEHILHHHERYDGFGYPKGIAGKAISIESRIIAVADAYDAMTSDRTYRVALSKEEAIEQLLRNSGTQFDPVVVRAFIKSM